MYQVQANIRCLHVLNDDYFQNRYFTKIKKPLRLISIKPSLFFSSVQIWIAGRTKCGKSSYLEKVKLETVLLTCEQKVTGYENMEMFNCLIVQYN